MKVDEEDQGLRPGVPRLSRWGFEEGPAKDTEKQQAVRWEEDQAKPSEESVSRRDHNRLCLS